MDWDRIFIEAGTHHVRVEVEGVEIANTRRPVLLSERGLRVRTYIPREDCRMDLMEPSTLTTRCPYKGLANYYSVRLPTGQLIKDVVWYYDDPPLKCAAIAGRLAFYDEKVDVWVNGEKRT